MKRRLNLTIDKDVLDRVKSFAASRETSVSELVETYFRSLAKQRKRKTIIDVVDKLEGPTIHPEADLKELFYLDQARKYGSQNFS